jgi:hypothetical protein
VVCGVNANKVIKSLRFAYNHIHVNILIRKEQSISFISFHALQNHRGYSAIDYIPTWDHKISIPKQIPSFTWPVLAPNLISQMPPHLV